MMVDRLLAARAAEGTPIRVGIYGAGFMARGLVNQIANALPGMVIGAICNRTPQKALAACEQAGIEAVVQVSSIAALDEAIARGAAAVTDDPALLWESDALDCLVDATGAIEYGALVTTKAIAFGRDLISMNAELDATVGPLLKRRADAAGTLLSGCDGDQPGVQMNLFRFVRSIGLTPLLCGNVKGLQDPYRTPTTQAAFAARWGQDPHMVTSFADGTKISFEQAMVANATGMSILRRGMTGLEHSGHVDELVEHFDIEALRAVGGAVDYVVGSRPGPGVFVLATHDDPKQRHYLELYKLGPGPLYSFYTPYHLCHFEVPLSVARAVLLRDPVIQPLDRPRVDVIATAKRDCAAGEVIDGLGGYMTYGQCETADIVHRDALLPIGLAEGARLTRAVKRDEVLTRGDVDLPESTLIGALRDEQDRMFFPALSPAA